MRKNIKRTIEDKNKIVKEYLAGERLSVIKRKYNIASDSMLTRWVNQYKKNGTTTDSRGKKSTGRPKSNKLIPEEMTREELIEYVKAVEDIKKLMAYQEKPKTNLK
ncbi:transposase [Mycoplasmatota bacterium WC44]